jgi:hypothetical protein
MNVNDDLRVKMLEKFEEGYDDGWSSVQYWRSKKSC